jgi:hypothetical protein
MARDGERRQLVRDDRAPEKLPVSVLSVVPFDQQRTELLSASLVSRFKRRTRPAVLRSALALASGGRLLNSGSR